MRPRLRALLAAADGRPDAIENTARAVDYCLRASAMAAQPADAQDARHQIELASDRSGFCKMWELTKSFRFEAAHSLTGTTLGEASDGNPRPLVPRRGERARHPRSRDRDGAGSRPARPQHGGGAQHRSTTSCSTRSKRWGRRRWKTCRASSGSGSSTPASSPGSACTATAATRAAPISGRRARITSFRHCEERLRRSNPSSFLTLPDGLLRFARNDGRKVRNSAWICP